MKSTEVNHQVSSQSIPDLSSWRQQLNSFGQTRTPCFFLISFDGQHSRVEPLSKLSDDIAFRFPQKTCGHNPFQPYPVKGDWCPDPLSWSMYKKIFYTIREHIFYGDTYLLNLTFSTPVKSSWSLEQMYHWARAPFMLLIKDAFICFSPERFVRIKDHQIEAFPMKGTADAWQCNAAQNLLESPKEKAEHAMVVDLLRNDLSRVANHVRVERFRFLEFIHRPQGDLLQTSSHIKGQLPCDWQNSIGDILWELLPAGSVSGTPKRKTSEIIQQVEHHNRGYFTGVFGYFDGESLDSGVLIRFVEKTSDGYLYKSGGGITWESCPHMEYQEMVNKIYVPLA